MNRRERIELTQKILGGLSDTPLTIKELAKQHELTEHTIRALITKLKKAGFVKIVIGFHGGAVRGKEATLDDILEAFGYAEKEKTVVACLECGEKKDRVKRYYKGENRNYAIFVDKAGKKWQGKLCPDCCRTEQPEVKLTTRKCRDCGKFLTASRYFSCLECKPSLGSIDDDMIYHCTPSVWTSLSEEWEQDDYNDFEDETTDDYSKVTDEIASD